jgi:two-component system sensor histidine kinase TctE
VRLTNDPAPGIAVSDDGPAIPPEERVRVFHRFHRLLGSSRDGSGLGLAIALEIARLHEAEITLADDNDGTGNTFTVTFPKEQRPLP